MSDITIDPNAPRLDLLHDGQPAEHARAMEMGCWQCPQCPEGWMQYSIATDMNVCPKCRYAGGAVSTNGGKPQSEAATGE